MEENEAKISEKEFLNSSLTFGSFKFEMFLLNIILEIPDT